MLKNHNNVPKNAANTILSIVIIVVSFTMVLFKSDAHYKVDDALSQKDTAMIARTQVQSVAKAMNSEDINIPGITGLTSSEADPEVERILASNPNYADKAHILATVYGMCIGTYGYKLTVGIMGHVQGEGSPGLVQYGHTIPNWNGSGSETSSASHQLYITTQANVNAMRACSDNPSNQHGFGMCQWTYAPSVRSLSKKYQEALDAGKDLTDPNVRLEIEVGYFPTWVDEHSANYKRIFLNSSSFYEAGYNFCRYIGQNNYQPESHEPTFRKRGRFAEEINDMLTAAGFQHPA